MKTNQRTTYILLERGVEDVELLKNIRDVFEATEMKGAKSLVRYFPVLYELKQELEKETEGF